MKKKSVLKNNRKASVKKYWWLGGLGLVLILVLVAGKVSGGLREDRFCQTKHKPVTEKPGRLDTAQDWLYMGDYDYESGNCQQAVKDLDRALILDPNYAEAYNNRGFIKRKLGLVAESIPDFDKAVELRPNYPHALMNRGDAYRQLNDKSEALKNYAMVIKLGEEAIKSEAVCGRREMLLHNNFLKAMWNAWTRHDDDGCWKMYFDR